MKNFLTTIICSFFIVLTSCQPEEVTPIHEFVDNDNVIMFQRHSKGEGIQIVLIADGYQDQTIPTLYNMYSHLFTSEPYPALKDYFTVIGIKEIDSLGITTYKDRYSGNKSYISRKVQKAANLTSIHNTAIVVAVSPKLNIQRSCCMLSRDHNEVTLSLCAYDRVSESYRRKVIAHEVGGHAIGALDDEYEEYAGEIPASAIASIQCWNRKGMFQNVIFSPELPSEWQQLQDAFGDEEVAIYEGGGLYETGVYRSSENSIMRTHSNRYNVVSEWLIWKSVIEHKGGLKTNIEEFISYRQQQSRSLVDESDAVVIPDFLHGVLIKDEE